MNNISEHENIITEQHKNRHDIKKYNFRNMEIAPKAESQPNMESSIQEETPKPQPTMQIVETPQPPIEQSIDAPALKLFETEVVDKILQKSDVLAESLQKLQEQFDKQEKEINEKVSLARNEAKEQGYNEGYQKAKQELEAQINSQKELYALSIQRIDTNILESKNHILTLEKELSSIALDIAKEVITAEINTNSAKIASALARTLLQDIAQNTQVTLKVFPGDLEELKESLKDLNNVHLEADPAIAKGGVVILSNEGNIDGNIFMRFETLKKSILENKS
ncbi:flagellar assembly protein FliH [Helicobacter winghamensis]|uniref:Flagellar assembly protein FliH n=1 Tax=Helicobacter winghamensis TaxID=157268 RepID=A0A2N3PJ04_9HELI|nr:flagellar assembly protein FliH [Helicobacter winghamensis]EEO25330.1 flagellar assembly protein FliH [Helicobacter winghamensis ATCC BAA-430]PKT76368.1 flagellar assembly protein FliH [Helicobacter winghamensis]PKT76499.1 flagellar assembly protein FliH [Helicobacter winghamensis]PKT76630.1 flagellar assembly protein FliH [Helicobacter winghamensis]PKT80879.1 flagellar assembly protein FliH [Helicobacter winghamensis]